MRKQTSHFYLNVRMEMPELALDKLRDLRARFWLSPAVAHMPSKEAIESLKFL
jgi:hypothetical protein